MKIFSLLLFLVGISNAAKIALFVLPLSNSHVIFTLRAAEELAVEHEVIIVRPSFNPNSEKLVSKHPRVREFRTAGVPPQTFIDFKKAETNHIWGNASWSEIQDIGTRYVAMITESCQDMVADDEFMSRMREEKFDLAITHHLDACPVSVIHAVGIPQFGYILSMPLIRTQLLNLGIPVFPSTVPSHLTDATNQMTFGQRLNNFVLEMWQSLVNYYQPVPIDAAFRVQFGDDFPSNGDLVQKGKFLLVNVHPDIEFPVPVTCKVTYIGGLAMSNESKPLEEPYLSFVNQSKKVVFVSFGTVADPKVMPTAWRRAFVGLFEKNPDINFIWRMENDVEVPKNVLRSLWHPQKDLLAHPNVVAFITHAGYNSIGESIASGTPLVTVPLFGDQRRNSRLAEYRGFGVRVEKNNMTSDALNDAMHKILDNPSFSSSAAALRKIAFSSPLKAGDSLRYAVNFALENPDYTRDLPSLSFFQLYSLDVFSLLISIPLLLFICVFLLFKLCYSCCRKANKEKEKTN